MSPLAPLAGALAGVGIAVAVAGLAPTRPDLAAALVTLDRKPSTLEPGARPPGGSRRLGRAVGAVLAGWGGRPPWIPAADLAVLERSVEALWAAKAALFALGVALPVPLAVLVHTLGFHVPLALPVAGCLAFGLLLSFAPDLVTRQAAYEARTAFRAAVGGYLTLVALERAADGGPAEALERAATVSDGWVFTRLERTLAEARLAGTPPWTALSKLAADVGVAELADLADIVALAAGAGAAIYDTLLAKAAAIRRSATTAATAAANTRSEQMTLPAAVLFLGYLLLLAYPAVARALGHT